MSMKYGVRTKWRKHLRIGKKYHWKSVRRLFREIIKRIKDGKDTSKFI